jgi:hypothetical protein
LCSSSTQAKETANVSEVNTIAPPMCFRFVRLWVPAARILALLQSGVELAQPCSRRAIAHFRQIG